MRFNGPAFVVAMCALGAGVYAQAPTVTKEAAPTLTELDAARVDISLLNETIVRLKIEKAALERELDVLRLTVDRQARTPAPKDGHVWDWTIDPQTGRPKGYVKPPAAK